MASRGALGESKSRNSEQAAREAVSAALDALGGSADALVVFATAGHDQPRLFEALRRAAGGAAIVGCTGAGVISRTGSDEGSHAVVVLALRSTSLRFTALHEHGLAADPEGIGRRLGARAARADQPRLLLVFPDGVSGSSTGVVRGLEATSPAGLVTFGGAAGELLQFVRTYQYGADGVASDSVAALLVEGDASFDVAVSHGCRSTGIEHTVTRAEGGTVHELDGRPAWEVMREYVVPQDDVLGTEDVAYLSLAQQEPDGIEVIRVPLRHDPATGALFFPGELRQGAVVTMARRDLDDVVTTTIASAQELAARAAGREPIFVLQADCVGRGHLLMGQTASERLALPVQRAFPTGAPWLGFYSYGEIVQRGGRLHYHNYTMALCAAYDGASPAPAPARGA